MATAVVPDIGPAPAPAAGTLGTPAAPASPAPAPVAPASAATPAPAAATPSEPVAPRSLHQTRQDAKRGAMDRARAAADARLAQAGVPTPAPAATSPAPATPAPAAAVDATVDAQGRRHAQDGKYLPGTGEPAAGTPAAPAAPSGLVRIPIPEGHGLRAQGLTEITAPADQERHIRTLLNGEVRRATLEQAQAAERASRERIAILEGELKAAQEARTRYAKEPTWAQDVAELRAIGRDDLADALLAGLEAQDAKKASEYSTEAQQRLQGEIARQKVATFQLDTLSAAKTRYPAFWVQSAAFEKAVERALYQYGTDIEYQERAGQPVTLETAKVWEYLDRLYLADPEGQKHTRATVAARRQREADAAAAKAKADADAKAAADAQAAAERHKTNNPLARIPSAVRTDRAVTAPAMDRKTMTAEQIKRSMRQQFTQR